MQSELLTIRVSFGEGSYPIAEISELLKSRLPTNLKFDHKILSILDQKVDTSNMDMRMFILKELSEEDYELLGRKYRDIKDITFGEMAKVGKPFRIGGGGGLVEFIISAITSDVTVSIASITAVATIVRELIVRYSERDDKKTITLKRGEDSITVTGYSKQEAERLVEDFFSKISRDELLKK